MSENQDLASLKIERGDETARGSTLGVVIGLIVVAAAVAVGAWWYTHRTPIVDVRTATAREVGLGQPTTVLNASGYVTARRMATVSSKVTGRVTEILIEEGMEVEEGQLLATIDPSNVLVNLRLAESELAAAIERNAWRFTIHEGA